MFSGSITRIIPIGAFVEILPGKEGMIHISQLSEARVEKVEDVVKVGDDVTVRVREIDSLSVKTVAEAVNQARPARLHILEKMLEAIDTPRDNLSPHAPRCLLYTSPSPRDYAASRMPSSA